MTEQNTPDVTDDDRRRAREWAESIESATNSVESTTNPWSDRALAAARVILHAIPAPPRPTLVGMTREERAECRWMQADVKDRGGRYVIANPCDEDADTGMVSAYGGIEWLPPEQVTPRPDLPRLEWPAGDEEAEDVPTVKVGDVIESADDPRLDALPVGTVLRDFEGEEVTRMGESADSWRGVGYLPVGGDGTEFGPWTVLHTPKGADQ